MKQSKKFEKVYVDRAQLAELLKQHRQLRKELDNGYAATGNPDVRRSV